MSTLYKIINIVRKIACKYNYVYILIFFVSISHFSCVSDQNFQGHLQTYIDNAEEINIPYSTIDMNGTYSPYVNVLDSIAIFYRTKEGKAFESVQLSTHEKTLFFCSLGHGHEEYTVLSPITQIYEDMNDMKTVLFAPNESKLLIWNISESIRKDSTIYESVIPYSWKDKFPVAFINQVMIGRDSILLCFPTLRISSDNQLTTRNYQIRTLKSNEFIREIKIFDHPIENKTSRVLAENFLGGYFSLKPDKSMFVEVMTWLPQINIVDIKTGNITGHRMKDTQEEDVFLTNMENALCCYTRVASDNNFIYALWSGTPRKELHTALGYNIIHVFNWEGKLVKKLRIENPINELILDSMNGNLYGWNVDKQRLYKYNLTSLIGHD